MPAAPARLRDVAALAGVSEKTVSNFVNGYPYMSVSTRQKVQAAITELNYRPNLSARNLSTGRTGFVALVVPGLTNPHFAELAENLIESARGERWTILIEQTVGNSEIDVLGSMRPMVDGVILHPESMTEAELARRAADIPIVLIVERSFEGVVADKVHVDNARAAYELARHLIQTGHRRIAAVAMDPNDSLPTSRLRYHGYARALQEAGIEVDPQLVVRLPAHNRSDGAAAARLLVDMDPRPDAVMCFNDLIAMGLLSGLDELGISVPDDIAVAGFDGTEQAAYSIPPLTTVAWDVRSIAEAAIRLLGERQREPSLPMREILIGHQLNVRESTAGGPGR